MNFEKLNHWLTLLANLGVLIGIFVVAVQLQQTQTEMSAESSTIRTEMLQQINNDALAYHIGDLQNKIEAGEELTSIESDQARTFFNNLLRFFENLHYQNQIGVLDEEIWKGQLTNIIRMCSGNNILYSHLYPEGITSTSYRESFRELMGPSCSE